MSSELDDPPQGPLTLIVDAGATKTEWVPVCGHRALRPVMGAGLNLASGSGDVLDLLHSEAARVAALLPVPPRTVEYYGAGCSGKMAEHARAMLREVFPAARIDAGSDLELAGRMLCPPGETGIVGILGTGAASGLFSDGRLVRRMPSLGYALGDEGSGAYMGVRVARLCLRGLADDVLTTAWKALGLAESDIVRRVYGGAHAGAFLGSLLRDVVEVYPSSPTLQEIVETSLRDYLTAVAASLRPAPDMSIALCGSVALNFETPLRRLAPDYGLRLTEIVKKPLDKLIK